VTTDPTRPYLTNYKRGYSLYRLLQGARNSKIIGLSGTPLINFPEEIAILANLLGGYIHTASFTVTPASDVNKKAIEKILKDHVYVDFAEVELQGLNMSVLMTCLPEGMIKAIDTKNNALGIKRVPSDVKTPTISECVAEIIGLLKEKQMRVAAPTFKSEALLPPVGQEFRDTFLEADGTTLKNTVVLRKRLQGLISYYRGSKKELMPTVTRDELVRVPFTPYAQAEYLRIRGEELKLQLEQKAKKKPGSGGEAGAAAAGKMGNLWAELYELAKMKSPNSYRMFSRQSCNFAFPEGISRPRPRNQQEAQDEIGKDKEIVDSMAEASKEAADVDAVVLSSSAEAEDANAAEAEAEDDAIDKGQKEEFLASAAAAASAASASSASAQQQQEAGDDNEVPLMRELEAVPAAPLPGAVAAGTAASGDAALKPKTTLTAINVLRKQQAKLQEDCKKGLAPGEKYLVATARAKKCLETFASPRLRLYPKGTTKKLEEFVKEGVEPNPEGLLKYSPKYAAILHRILSGKGSSLVYSQFLDMEGIGIFLVVLKINDFQPIVIEESGKFSAETIKSLKRGPGVNRFLSFTGGESREVRRSRCGKSRGNWQSTTNASKARGNWQPSRMTKGRPAWRLAVYVEAEEK
jgi:hypothetical protein